ncbi:MAG: PASTA domain-containing protein, partial [Firmicutes bacterium]|nr:PASTA domain-containing protein [Bacillota bacterium]
KVQKKLALQRIAQKVEPEIAALIIDEDLPGVVVDEDVERIYPYSGLAAHVLGFVGKDNQGIIGLESKYNDYLKGEAGKILTLTDVRGIETGDSEERIEPVPGGNLVLSLDITVQQYAEQVIKAAVTAKSAKNGMIIVMNPQNGELLAMALYPGFDLNEPFKINNEELAAIWDELPLEKQTENLNLMWRNTAINDTYEPGSTFKIVTAAAGLEEGIITPESSFFCNGYHIAGDRMIKCWRYPRTHGAQNFVQGVQNSCNPVFMITAEKLGAEGFYEYLLKFGFDKKTGVDLPGEARGIMYPLEKVGPVELATMSFGQSITITPLQLLRAASAAVNGGYLITPHFGMKIVDENGNTIEEFEYKKGERILSEEVSKTMSEILESVVSEGTGNKAYIPGMRIGGKTATSEKLPRSSNQYIASFLSFAPADDPQVMALVLIDEPQGVYYGGTVAGPVMKELLSNILPYLGLSPEYTPEEAEQEAQTLAETPNILEMELPEALAELQKAGLNADVCGSGEKVFAQFPSAGTMIKRETKVIIYTEVEL